MLSFFGHAQLHPTLDLLDLNCNYLFNLLYWFALFMVWEPSYAYTFILD